MGGFNELKEIISAISGRKGICKIHRRLDKPFRMPREKREARHSRLDDEITMLLGDDLPDF